VCYAGASEAWAMGVAGIAMHYRNNAWSSTLVPLGRTLYGVSFSSVYDGWAVGQGGAFYHYTSSSDVAPTTLGRVKALFR